MFRGQFFVDSTNDCETSIRFFEQGFGFANCSVVCTLVIFPLLSHLACFEQKARESVKRSRGSVHENARLERFTLFCC